MVAASEKPPPNTLRILILGPLPPPFTGSTSLVQYLVEYCEKHPGVETLVLNTMGVRGQGLKGGFRFLRLLWRVFRATSQCDVLTLHCSTTGLDVMGSVALFFSSLLRKPLIIRKFAGNDYRDTLRGFRRYLAGLALRRADLYLAETKALVKAAHEQGIHHVEWYANSRPIPEASSSIRPREHCRKFVYIGRVREAKGMRILAKAAAALPDYVTIDIYGPWSDDLEQSVFDSCPAIRYHGPLRPEEIVPTMREYDASILPSLFTTEGYPGAILESYIAGLPVIATRVGAIPEILDESVGILIEPNDPDALARAIMRLAEDPLYYKQLQANTAGKTDFFSSERWGEEFVRLCRRTAGK